jgi:hypothetical protein
MAISREWDPVATARSIEERLRDADNRERLVEEPRRQIETFLRVGEGSRRRVGLALGWMSTWYLADAARAVLDGAPDALERLDRAHQFGIWHIRLTAPGSGTKPKPIHSLRDLGLTLARALALGRLDEAEELGGLMLRGLVGGLVHGAGVTWVGVFLLRLHGSWKQVDVWMPDQVFLPLEGYQPLLDHWQIADDALVSRAILQACDFHTRLNGDLDDERIVDFWIEVYQIYPVEILAVLRLRQVLGLATPPLSHPLLDSPLGRPRPVREVPPDPFLASVIAAMEGNDQGP